MLTDTTYDALVETAINLTPYLRCTLDVDYPAWYGPSDSGGPLAMYTHFGTGQLNGNLSLDILQRLGWVDKRMLMIMSININYDGLYECSAPNMTAHAIRVIVWGRYQNLYLLLQLLIYI